MALRRQATEPGEVRLLDSLLRPAQQREREARDQAQRDQRREYLERRLSQEGQAELRSQRDNAVKAMTRAIAQRDHLLPHDAEPLAREVLGSRWAEEDREAQTELRQIASEPA